jgi:hypothetical protein
MYTAPNVETTVSPKEGLMAWARGVEAWLDARGRKAWIIAMILGFIFVWPVGLALLAYMIWSNRMFSRNCTQTQSAWSRGGKWGGGMGKSSPFRSSGNSAFDAYKEETIRRLQEEQEAFEAFLQRLRDAKDKSEFDTFMSDRARGNAQGEVLPEVKSE